MSREEELEKSHENQACPSPLQFLAFGVQCLSFRFRTCLLFLGYKEHLSSCLTIRILFSKAGLLKSGFFISGLTVPQSLFLIENRNRIFLIGVIIQKTDWMDLDFAGFHSLTIPYCICPVCFCLPYPADNLKAFEGETTPPPTPTPHTLLCFISFFDIL